MTELTSSITVLLQCKEISLYRESSMIVLFQEPGKKATRFVAQQNLESPPCFFFVLTSFTQFFRLHHWHCPRITSFVSLRGIKAGNPVRERGNHLSSSGNQSEHFAKKISFPFLEVVFLKKTHLWAVHSIYSEYHIYQEFPMQTYRKTDFRSKDYL